MISVIALLLNQAQAIITKSCILEHIKLSTYESIELETPSFPAFYSGPATCTYKLEAPQGYRPAVEFLSWDMNDCSSNKFTIIDKKQRHHHIKLCGYGIPAPLTAVGRYLEFVMSLNSRGGSTWGMSQSGVRFKIRVSLVRNANWKASATQKSEYSYTQASPTSIRHSNSDEWDWSFTTEEITNIGIGGAFVFITILGGLVFSFHLKREEKRKNSQTSDPTKEKQGHPRPTGHRAYLHSIRITRKPDEVQTSSTDLGDTTETTSNTESNPATDLPMIHKPVKQQVKYSRDQRRKRANERTNPRTTMEKFQRDLNHAFKASGIDPNQQISEDLSPAQKCQKWAHSDTISSTTETTVKQKRGNYERFVVPENPKNNQVSHILGRQTRYKDQDYEKWTETGKIGKVRRSETMREKIRRAFSVKSIKETIHREKSRLYGPHARPPMRQRKQNDPQDNE